MHLIVTFADLSHLLPWPTFIWHIGAPCHNLGWPNSSTSLMYIIVYDTLVHPVMTLITYILNLHLHDMLLHPVMTLITYILDLHLYDMLLHPVMTLITYILDLHLYDMLLHPVMILADVFTYLFDLHYCIWHINKCSHDLGWPFSPNFSTSIWNISAPCHDLRWPYSPTSLTYIIVYDTLMHPVMTLLSKTPWPIL